MKNFFLINWSSHVFHGPRKKIRSIWSRQISKKIPPTFILLFPPQNISCASRRKPASYAPVPLRSTAILLQFYNWSRFFPRINGSRFCSCIIEFQLEQLDSVFARGNVVDNDRGCDPGNAIRLISNLDHLEFDPLKLMTEKLRTLWGYFDRKVIHITIWGEKWWVGGFDSRRGGGKYYHVIIRVIRNCYNYRKIFWWSVELISIDYHKRTGWMCN